MLKQFKRFMEAEDRIGYALIFCVIFTMNMFKWGSLLPLGFMALSCIYIIRTWKTADKSRIVKNLYFFVFVGLALISTFWSQYPMATLRGAVQLLITIAIAVYFGSTRNIEQIIFPLARALLLYTVLSLAFGQVVAVGNDGETGLTGFGGGAKNFFSDASDTCLILSLACLFFDINAKRYIKACFSLIALPICAIAVYRSNSAGGIVDGALGCVVFIYLLGQARFPLPLKLTVGALMCAWLGFGLAFKDEIQTALFGAFHKDSTLTGRVYLWYRAGFYMAQKPWLGVGYYAFWQPPNVEAQGLWDYNHIASRMGFTFHNTYIQLRVDMGYLGLATYLSMLLFGFARWVKIILGRPTTMQIGAFSYLAFVMLKSTVEMTAPIPFSMPTMLFCMFLCMSVAAHDKVQSVQRPIRWRHENRLAPVAPS